MARAGNNPKRRIAAVGYFTAVELEEVARRAIYVGSAIHKRFPADYGFVPPTNPRAWKSLCDGARIVLRAEAQQLLETGIRRGLVSTYLTSGIPKYIWAVDHAGLPFEAKIGLGGYHGYLLEPDDDMSYHVLKAWRER